VSRPLLSSTICPLFVSTSHNTACSYCVTMCTTDSRACPFSVSTSHYTVCLFCVTISTALFYPLQCPSVPNTALPVGSLSLCPLVTSTLCRMSVSKSQGTVFFSVVLSTVFYIRSTAVFYYLSLSQHITLYQLLVLCHYVHCCLVHCVHRLSVPHILLSLFSLTQSPLLSSRIAPISASTSKCTVLCHYAHCCLLQSVQYLSEPHIVQSVFPVSLCPLLYSTVCPISVILHIVPSFGSVSQCLLLSFQSVHYLSVTRTVLSLYSVPQCPLLNSTVCPLCVSTTHTVPAIYFVSLWTLVTFRVCPLSVCTSHFTVCWLCATIFIAVF